MYKRRAPVTASDAGHLGSIGSPPAESSKEPSFDVMVRAILPAAPETFTVSHGLPAVKLLLRPVDGGT
jgi:hypothetical protein